MSKLKSLVLIKIAFLVNTSFKYYLGWNRVQADRILPKRANDNFFWMSLIVLCVLLASLILAILLLRFYFKKKGTVGFVTGSQDTLSEDSPKADPIIISGYGDKSLYPPENEYTLKCLQKLGKIGYWKCDCLNQQLFLSDAIYEILGMDNSEKILFIDDFINLIDYNKRSYVMDLFYGRPKNDGDYAVEFTITGDGGHCRTYGQIASYEKNDAGDIVFMEGILTLKTESVKSSTNLNIDIKKTLEKDIAGVLFIDPTGLILTFNTRAKEMFETYQKWPCAFNLNFIHVAKNQDDQKFLKHFENACKGGDEEYDKYYLGTDGYGCWVHYTMTPVHESSRITGVCITSRDVTLTKNYLSMIEEQNRALFDISWMQSHLVRSPLARIMGLVELIILEMNLEDEQAILFRHLIDSTRDLDNIIKKISAFTDNIVRIDGDNIVPHFNQKQMERKLNI